MTLTMRNYGLVLPTNYVSIEKDEMEYIDGGATWWQKTLVGAAIVAAGVGLVVALSYGQIWLASTIMKKTFSAVVKKIGVKGVVKIVGKSLGVGTAAVTAALMLVF